MDASRPPVEVVIPSIRSLRNLESWRQALGEIPIIVIQDGDPNAVLDIPTGFDITVWNRTDIVELLGDRSWAISTLDSACRCFGFLVSRAKYIYTLDDDCTPPPDDRTSETNPLLRHLTNLQEPCYPDYFNTLYDVEFVRGYPHSLRKGQPTAISHGLWLEHPDLDALTQRDRPHLRIKTQVPVVQTVPRGAQYSMCGMNVAFDRDLIGPAMYFGLMGQGQPWGRYDDLWAGWCSKAICDHLGYGCKTGLPYIVHEKASNWENNLRREAKGLEWADDLFRFFRTLQFTAENDTVEECYLQIADQVESELAGLDPYFLRLAKAMRVWIGLWNDVPDLLRRRNDRD
jgi:reversibly glycosylated polypeptide / UDP-arabinopyranose mutase